MTYLESTQGIEKGEGARVMGAPHALTVRVAPVLRLYAELSRLHLLADVEEEVAFSKASASSRRNNLAQGGCYQT